MLWNKNGLTLSDLNFEIVKVYLRTPHIERDVLRCRECGQLYFHEWYDHVNFTHDNDMYDTYIPVESQEEIDTLAKTPGASELSQYLPQIHGSHTNGHDDALHWILENQK